MPGGGLMLRGPDARGGGVGSVLPVALPLPLVSFSRGVVEVCFPRAVSCVVLVALPLPLISLAGGSVIVAASAYVRVGRGEPESVSVDAS